MLSGIITVLQILISPKSSAYCDGFSSAMTLVCFSFLYHSSTLDPYVCSYFLRFIAGCYVQHVCCSICTCTKLLFRVSTWLLSSTFILLFVFRKGCFWSILVAWDWMVPADYFNVPSWCILAHQVCFADVYQMLHCSHWKESTKCIRHLKKRLDLI